MFSLPFSGWTSQPGPQSKSPALRNSLGSLMGRKMCCGLEEPTWGADEREDRQSHLVTTGSEGSHTTTGPQGPPPHHHRSNGILTISRHRTELSNQRKEG